MTYSTDFRRRVIARVQSGDSKSAACRLFGISRSTLHSWLNRADLSPSQGGFRHRKLDRRDFERHVAEHPDALQHERAAHFRVSTSSIRHALKRNLEELEPGIEYLYMPDSVHPSGRANALIAQ